MDPRGLGRFPFVIGCSTVVLPKPPGPLTSYCRELPTVLMYRADGTIMGAWCPGHWGPRRRFMLEYPDWYGPISRGEIKFSATPR